MYVPATDTELEVIRGFLKKRGGKLGFLILFIVGEIVLLVDYAKLSSFDFGSFLFQSFFWFIWCFATYSFVMIIKATYLISKPVAIVFAALFAFVFVRYFVDGGSPDIMFGGASAPIVDYITLMLAPFMGTALIQLVMFGRALFMKDGKDGDKQLADAIRKQRADK